MSSERSRDFIRRGFILAAAGGLLLNLIFVFLSFSKNRDSDLLAGFVEQSLQASLHLERLDRLLSSLEPDANKIQHEIALLEKFQPVLPAGFSVAVLEKQMRQNSADAALTISNLRDALDLELIHREEDNNSLNSVVDRDMRLALFFDFLLFCLLLTLFAWNARDKIRVENNLKSSLFVLRESVQALEEQALQRQMEAKTTVHDLKNPIGTIMGFAQIMNEGHSSISVAEASSRIRRISERSLILVESLLVSDQSARPPMKDIDLIPLAEDICSQLDFQAAQKSQKILRDFRISRAVIHGNSLKLEELMVNILGNALKYSPPKSRIRFVISKKENYLHLEIEDQGPGFSTSDKQNAFQYGVKLSAKPTGNESSTGFGLYISKQIAALHKGQIRIVDSPSGRGSCLVIDLPLTKVGDVTVRDVEKR